MNNIEKILQNRILVIITFIFIAISVVFLVMFVNKQIEKNKENKKTAITEQLTELGVDEDEALNMDEEEATETINEKIKALNLPGYVFDAGRTEYSNTDAKYSIILDYLTTGNYNSIVTEIGEIKDKYNFTTLKNMKLITAYNDAKKLSGNSDWTQSDYDNFLLGAENSETYLKGVFSTPGYNFNDFFLDPISLFPYFTGSYTIKGETIDLTNKDEVEKLKKDKYYDNISDYYQGSFTILDKIYLEGITGNIISNATCYVVSANNLNYKVIGCYNDTDTMFTVADWISLHVSN